MYIFINKAKQYGDRRAQEFVEGNWRTVYPVDVLDPRGNYVFPQLPHYSDGILRRETPLKEAAVQRETSKQS
ncbi:MAG: hypothetical protein JZD41_05670 [Thermoproteus sp.]|nr:hypothetical protein [Thermoproteus sp.]